MKAAVCTRYGPPDIIQIMDVEKPVPKEDEVLIAVRAASVNPLDVGSIKGKPYIARIVTGLRKPKMSRPGIDVAGRVEAVGRNVTQFKAADAVFGLCISDPKVSGVGVWTHHQGAFAEYVCVPESILVVKPDKCHVRASSFGTGGGVDRIAGCSRQRTDSTGAKGFD
jgi:NADPH:quinone reductase-like Zn-dependent oxidoreductase